MAGEGKEIQKLTNPQVTYSKRRNGLLNKAQELSVISDDKFSIFMISSTGKLDEYSTPGTSLKELIDEYQKVKGVDLFKQEYQIKVETLKKLKEVNAELRREIGLRKGNKEMLNEQSFEQLGNLEGEIESSLQSIRKRKEKVLMNKTEIAKKKKRNEEQQFEENKAEYDARYMHHQVQVEYDPHYGLLVDKGYGYNHVHGVPSIFGFHPYKDL